MNNLSAVSYTYNPAPASRNEAKNNSRVEGNFLRVALENFKLLAASQTVMVPGSYNEAAAGFLKTKTEIEAGLPDAEDSLEDKVDSLIARIGALLKK